MAEPVGKQEKGPNQVKRLLRDKRFYMLVPSLMFSPFFLTGLFIHQNLLAGAKNWSLEWMATGFVGYGVSRMITNFLAGSIIDRFTAKKIYVFHLLPILLALVLLFVGNHIYILQMYMILLGVSISLKGIAGTALWAEIYGVQRLGTIKSVSATIIVFATAFGPVIMGYTFEVGLYFTLSLAFALAVISTLLAWKTLK